MKNLKKGWKVREETNLEWKQDQLPINRFLFSLAGTERNQLSSDERCERFKAPLHKKNLAHAKANALHNLRMLGTQKQ